MTRTRRWRPRYQDKGVRNELVAGVCPSCARLTGSSPRRPDGTRETRKNWWPVSVRPETRAPKLNRNAWRKFRRRSPWKATEKCVSNLVPTGTHPRGEWPVSEPGVMSAVKESTSAKIQQTLRFRSLYTSGVMFIYSDIEFSLFKTRRIYLFF